jgi:histidinol-phosphate aminotransferase
MRLSIDKRIKDIPYYPKAMMYGIEDGWIRLSSNENPFPPSPNVLSAIIDGLPYLTRYPGLEFELKSAISQRFSLKPEDIVVGNGSNELIEMALKAMKEDYKDRVIITEPSFAFYNIASMIYGYQVVSVPLNGMKVDLSAVLQRIDERTRLIFINNPNNPTGTIFEAEELRHFLNNIPKDILVVIDEAYGEFVESHRFPDSIRYINDFPVLVLKTFSKAYGLAGLRVGYGICDAGLAEFIERTKQPFSVNIIALLGALAALKDDTYLKKVLANNRRGKRFLYQQLKEASIEFVPTEANFIIIRLGENAKAIVEMLYEEKVLVRWMGAYGMPDFIRVTVGTMSEIDDLLMP